MALDKHLADQLVIPMALANGESKFTTCEITQHLLTNIAVVRRFLNVGFRVSSKLGAAGMVEKTNQSPVMPGKIVIYQLYPP